MIEFIPTIYSIEQANPLLKLRSQNGQLYYRDVRVERIWALGQDVYMKIIDSNNRCTADVHIGTIPTQPEEN